VRDPRPPSWRTFDSSSLFSALSPSASGLYIHRGQLQCVHLCSCTIASNLGVIRFRPFPITRWIAKGWLPGTEVVSLASLFAFIHASELSGILSQGDYNTQYYSLCTSLPALTALTAAFLALNIRACTPSFAAHRSTPTNNLSRIPFDIIIPVIMLASVLRVLYCYHICIAEATSGIRPAVPVT
jgi:hypothetical protein